MPHTMKAANLAKWFPPWTVSREMWREALLPQVSGVSTDILLFSERGAPLIHHYRVFGGGSAHVSLSGILYGLLSTNTVPLNNSVPSKLWNPDMGIQ